MYDIFTILTLYPVAFESAALVDKLLNDLLKTTEGFQKLKKMNDELKLQVSNDTHYVSRGLSV